MPKPKEKHTRVSHTKLLNQLTWPISFVLIDLQTRPWSWSHLHTWGHDSDLINSSVFRQNLFTERRGKKLLVQHVNSMCHEAQFVMITQPHKLKKYQRYCLAGSVCYLVRWGAGSFCLNANLKVCQNQLDAVVMRGYCVDLYHAFPINLVNSHSSFVSHCLEWRWRETKQIRAKKRTGNKKGFHTEFSHRQKLFYNCIVQLSSPP